MTSRAILNGWPLGGGSRLPIAIAPGPLPDGATLPPVDPPTPVATALSQGAYNAFMEVSYAPAFTFINRMKSSDENGPWTDNPPLSAFGYPTAFPNGKTSTRSQFSFRRPTTGALDFVVRNNGTDLQYSLEFAEGLTLVSSTPNRRVYRLAAIPGQRYARIGIQITGVSVWPDYRANEPMATRDGIAIYELEREADYLAGVEFYSDYVREMARSTGKRWMECQKTNNSVVKTLADRTPVGNCSYSQEAVRGGYPLETMVALCNAAKAYPGSRFKVAWFCIPHDSNEEYQRWFINYVRANLDPAITPRFEWSNEVWNPGFGLQNGHAVKTARDINPNWAEPEGYAILSARLALLVKEIYGADFSRVSVVFARSSEIKESYLNSTAGFDYLGVKPGDLFTAGASGFYNDGGWQAATASTATPDQIALAEQIRDNWEAQSPDPAQRPFSPAFVSQYREGTGLGLPNLSTGVQVIENSRLFGIWLMGVGIHHHVGYEGQLPHVTAIALGGERGARVNRMLSQLSSTPAISGLNTGSYLYWFYRELRKNGMTAHNYFNDYGILDWSSSWPTKPDPFQPDTGLAAFYDWLQTNAPPLLFVLKMMGSATIPLGVPFTRKFFSFGGHEGLEPLVARSPLIPGTTFTRLPGLASALSGTANAEGDYPLVLSRKDGAGNEITETFMLKVRAQAGFRAFRTFCDLNARGDDPSNSFMRAGCSEIEFMEADLVTPIARDPMNWSATSTSPFGINPPSRLVDGDKTVSFISQNNNGQPTNATIDVGEGYLIRPGGVRFYNAVESDDLSFKRLQKIEAAAGPNGTYVQLAGVSNLTYTTVSGNLKVSNVIPFVYP